MAIFHKIFIFRFSDSLFLIQTTEGLRFLCFSLICFFPSCRREASSVQLALRLAWRLVNNMCLVIYVRIWVIISSAKFIQQNNPIIFAIIFGMQDKLCKQKSWSRLKRSIIPVFMMKRFWEKNPSIWMKSDKNENWKCFESCYVRHQYV